MQTCWTGFSLFFVVVQENVLFMYEVSANTAII